MLDRLRTLLRRLAWDARISWRLDNQHLRPFHDAPDEVVERWAAIDPNSVRRYQLQAGILMARDEQTQRQCRWQAAGAEAQVAPGPARCACRRGHVGLERSWLAAGGYVRGERHGAEVCQEGVSGHEAGPPTADDADPYLQTR
jgi:hypothetical protein